MTEPTPAVDAVLIDPLAIPPGVGDWLRTIEARARSLQREIRQRYEGGAPIPVVVEACEAIDRFLADHPDGPLRRLLRRPLKQLRLGSPAADAFDRYARGLFTRGEQALILQNAAERLLERVAEIRGRYAATFPRSTRHELDVAGVTRAAIERIRCPADTGLFTSRLARVEEQLARLASECPLDPCVTPTSLEEEPGQAAITLHELAAALDIRRHERALIAPDLTSARQLRNLMLKHLSRLCEAAMGHSESTTAEFVASRMARDACALQPGEDNSILDAPLWVGLISAAAHATYGGGGWTPRVLPPEEKPASPPIGTVLYVIGIDETYAYFTPLLPSPVRVWTPQIGLGDIVECIAFGEGAGVPEDLVAWDLEPFFQGIDADQLVGWFETRRKARFRVVCRYEGGWFARLEQHGALERLHTTSWRHHGGAGPVSVFPSRWRPVEAVESGVDLTDSPPVSFLAFHTREVRLGRIERRTALFRYAESAAAVGLKRERDFFRALHLARPSLGLEYLGPARLPGPGTTGWLYGRPLAWTVAESPLIAEWTGGPDRLLFARALAAALLAVHATGYVLGVCPLDAFAFSVCWPRLGAAPAPMPVVMYAPFATLVGERFPLYGEVAGSTFPEYMRLRFRSVPAALERGEPATVATDIEGWAWQLLESLAERPIVEAGTWIERADLPGRVLEDLGAFSDQALTRGVAEALAASSYGQLQHLMHGMSAMRNTVGHGVMDLQA